MIHPIRGMSVINIGLASSIWVLVFREIRRIPILGHITTSSAGVGLRAEVHALSPEVLTLRRVLGRDLLSLFGPGLISCRKFTFARTVRRMFIVTGILPTIVPYHFVPYDLEDCFLASITLMSLLECVGAVTAAS